MQSRYDLTLIIVISTYKRVCDLLPEQDKAEIGENRIREYVTERVKK